MTKLTSWRTACACASLAALTACGGGGGGGDSAAPAPAPSPAPASDPNAPDFRLSADFTSAEGAGIAMGHLEKGSQLLDLARFAVDMAQRFAGNAPTAPITANCAYAGRITLSLEDRDNDRRASTGDLITATLSGCGIPRLGRMLTGTMQVQLLAVAPTADIAVRARLTLVEGLRSEAIRGGPNLGDIAAGTHSGSLNIDWSSTATSHRTTVSTAAGEELRFVPADTPRPVTEVLRQVDVQQTIRFDLARITTSLDFLSIDRSGRRLLVRTPQPLEGDLNVASRVGRLEAEGAGGWRLRTEAGSVITGPSFFTRVVAPDGTTGTPYNRPGSWQQLMSLAQDPRSHAPVRQDSSVGSGYTVLAPWHQSTRSEIDFACEQVPSAGISTYRADPLFQRPVVVPPGLADGNAVVQLQFRRALAEAMPTPQFRWSEQSPFEEGGTLPWSVATTVVRRGALLEIRTPEPLRRQRLYDLLSSFDGGVTWTGDRQWLDDAGQVVASGFSSVMQASLDGTIVASTASSDLGLVAAAAPARLRANVRLQDGRTLKTVRWEQLSGAPLRLADAGALETDAVPTSSEARPVEDAILQVTVTDNLGETDRARVTLKAGTTRATGAVLYTEDRRSAAMTRRDTITGVGSIFQGPSAGLVSPRVPGPSEGGTGVNFSVVPAGGGRLAQGLYADALRSISPGSRNGLVSRVFCNTLDAPVTGSFEVLDVAYADDGSITRLAIDFTQTCGAGDGEYQRGSYRFNSAVPLRP